MIIETIYEWSILNLARRLPQTNGYHIPLTFEGTHNFMILKRKTKERFLIIFQPFGFISSITYHLCLHKLNSSSESILSQPLRA